MYQDRIPRRAESEGADAPQSLPPNAKPLPQELHSAYAAKPFEKCSSCSARLDSGCLYEIQKVFRMGEVIFEMALCQTCGEEACREFSEESMEALKGFLMCNFTPSPASCHCNFCGFPRAILDRFTLIGACQEQSLLLPPITLCDGCAEALQCRVSPKTRETQEEFLRKNFPGVPGALDLNPSIGGFLA